MDDYVPTSEIAAGLECIIVSVMVALQFLAILWLLIQDGESQGASNARIL